MYVNCTDTEEEAIKIIKEIFNVHENGGYHIHDWIRTSKKVMHQIPDEIRSKKLDIYKI